MTAIEEANRRFWGRARPYREYDNLILRPVETVVLARYSKDFAGRVLELGCGSGRMTWYLTQLGEEVDAVDVSEQMLARCSEVAPRARRHLADFTALPPFEAGSFSAIVAPCNVIDVLTHPIRRRLLAELNALLAPGGLLFFSSHNRGAIEGVPRPWQMPRRHLGRPVLFLGDLLLLPLRLRNHLRYRRLEQSTADHALLNDSSHDYATILYFIGRDAQERQLAEAGFELLECIELDGGAVAAGESASERVELHYVARRL